MVKTTIIFNVNLTLNTRASGAPTALFSPRSGVVNSYPNRVFSSSIYFYSFTIRGFFKPSRHNLPTPTMSKKQHLNRTQRTDGAVLIQRIDHAETFRSLPLDNKFSKIIDHKMNSEELSKHPLPNIPFLSHHLLKQTMTTHLGTYLALIQLARTEAHWTAKEDSDWDSLVRFLLTKSRLVPPAVQIDTLRHSLSRAAEDIVAATAALGNTAPPGNIHAAWPPSEARSSHVESPPRRSYRGTQGTSPSPKRRRSRLCQQI